MSTFAAGGVVNQGLVSLTRGATTATALPTPFPALTADGVSSRAIQLRLRMLGVADKDALWRYN